MAEATDTRYEYIDAVKGVAILCITLLHFEDGVFPPWLNNWIGLFMITAFYFVSGYLSGLKNKTVSHKELLFNRLRQLGIPYVCFTLLILAFDMLWYAFGFMEIKTILRDIYKSIVLCGIGTLWFLPVLLFGEWLFCVIRTNKRPLLFAALALVVTMVVSYIYNTYWLPMRNIDDFHRIIDAPMRPIVYSLNAWPVIGLGFLAGRYLGPVLHRTYGLRTCIVGVLLIIFSLWIVISPPFNIYYVNDIMSNTIPVLGFLCVFAAIGNGLLTRFFAYWGYNSLILMCTHYSITEVLLKTFDSQVLHHAVFSGPRTLVYFVIAVFLTYPIVWLFNHKLWFMLGKNRSNHFLSTRYS